MPLIPEFKAIVGVVQNFSRADQKFLARTISHYIVALENTKTMTPEERAEFSRLSAAARQKEIERIRTELRRYRSR